MNLLTEDYIKTNQDFFETCAFDYRKLATELIHQLAVQLQVTIDKDSPLKTFNPLKHDTRCRGTVNGWSYSLHGFHCGFENKKSGQRVEASLAFGQEFGELDPYFFSIFLETSPNYQPLSFPIDNLYGDGLKIIETMVELGKFEKRSSNVGDFKGFFLSKPYK